MSLFTDAKGRFHALTVKRMGETRMGSAYGMMKRNVKLASAFAAIAADPLYNKKCGISKARAAAADRADAAAAAADGEDGEDGAVAEEEANDSDGSDGSSDGGEEPTTGALAGAAKATKKQSDYLEVKRLMKDEQFVSDTQAAIDLIRPVMKALRVADRRPSQHPIVWETMARLDEHYSKLADEYKGPIPVEQVCAAHQAVVDRWEYLHDKTHSAAYALNPHFHEVDIGAEESVMNDLAAVVADFYSDEEQQAKAMLEFQEYKRGSSSGHHPQGGCQ